MPLSQIPSRCRSLEQRFLKMALEVSEDNIRSFGCGIYKTGPRGIFFLCEQEIIIDIVNKGKD